MNNFREMHTPIVHLRFYAHRPPPRKKTIVGKWNLCSSNRALRFLLYFLTVNLLKNIEAWTLNRKIFFGPNFVGVGNRSNNNIRPMGIHS